MKLMTLNTWGGRAGHSQLLDFFRDHADKIDIFCLQEMWSAAYNSKNILAVGVHIDQTQIFTDSLQQVSAQLPNYQSWFQPQFGEHYGILTLAKHTFKSLRYGYSFIHKYAGYDPGKDIGKHARSLQYITFGSLPTQLTVINLHGLWNGLGKQDSKERILQSKLIKEQVQKFSGAVIVCGDFNLLPNTQSIQILEKAGLRNLVSEFHITSTRSDHYTKPDKYADYIFVNEKVKVHDLYTLSVNISDHLPLVLDFSL